MPSGGGVSDPTMRNAVRAMMLEHDIRLVEECCKQAAPFAWRALLKNVTQAVPYEYQSEVFSGRRQFYEARRRFFFLLDQAKTDIKG